MLAINQQTSPQRKSDPISIDDDDSQTCFQPTVSTWSSLVQHGMGLAHPQILYANIGLSNGKYLSRCLCGEIASSHVSLAYAGMPVGRPNARLNETAESEGSLRWRQVSSLACAMAPSFFTHHHLQQTPKTKRGGRRRGSGVLRSLLD